AEWPYRARMFKPAISNRCLSEFATTSRICSSVTCSHSRSRRTTASSSSRGAKPCSSRRRSNFSGRCRRRSERNLLRRFRRSSESIMGQQQERGEQRQGAAEIEGHRRAAPRPEQAEEGAGG